MTLVERIYAQAEALCGQVEETLKPFLRAFCQSAVVGMEQRLKEGLTPDDCKADFIAAGALYALAALTEVDPTAAFERVQFGDVTLVSGGASAASRCLRRQADMILSPFCRGTFEFRRV